MATADSEVYTDPEGWSIVVPRTMHLERSGWSGRMAVREVTVASFPMRTAVGPTGNIAPPFDLHGEFLPSAVAFRMLLYGGWPGHLSGALESAESRFPISLDTFAPTEHPDAGAPPRLSGQ